MRWLEKYPVPKDSCDLVENSCDKRWAEMCVDKTSVMDSLENQENPFIPPGFSQLKDAEICLQVKWNREVLSGRNISKMANCDILHYGCGYFWQDK